MLELVFDRIIPKIAIIDESTCYGTLQGLASDEGKPVGFQAGPTLEACKTSCDNNDRCESISMCDNPTSGTKDCYFKDKNIVTPTSEAIDNIRTTCVTVYKSCEKGTIL